MTGKERFEYVIRRIILPHYPMLESVEVIAHGGTLKTYFYSVTYLSDKMLDTKLMQKISAETVSLFHMMGEEKDSDLQIYFKDRFLDRFKKHYGASE